MCKLNSCVLHNLHLLAPSCLGWGRLTELDSHIDKLEREVQIWFIIVASSEHRCLARYTMYV